MESDLSCGLNWIGWQLDVHGVRGTPSSLLGRGTRARTGLNWLDQTACGRLERTLVVLLERYP